MILEKWLDRAGMSRAEFADVVGVTRSCVNHWINSLRFPRPESLELIEKSTRGEVTEKDFVRQFNKMAKAA